MGFRFQKRISVLPGVRINLSKSGASASVGPRGADVNIGPHGVTTDAGIPGTGLSYRQKAGGGKTWIAIAALVGGLGVWGLQHLHKVETAISRVAAPVRTASTIAPAPVNTTANTVRYVHRAGSVLRAEPKTSAESLRKESKGVQVILLSEADGWAQVKDGDVTGWMRASVLGEQPPQ